MTTYARFASILGALALATTIGVAAQGKSEQAKRQGHQRCDGERCGQDGRHGDEGRGEGDR